MWEPQLFVSRRFVHYYTLFKLFVQYLMLTSALWLGTLVAFRHGEHKCPNAWAWSQVSQSTCCVRESKILIITALGGFWGLPGNLAAISMIEQGEQISKWWSEVLQPASPYLIWSQTKCQIMSISAWRDQRHQVSHKPCTSSGSWESGAAWTYTSPASRSVM